MAATRTTANEATGIMGKEMGLAFSLLRFFTPNNNYNDDEDGES